LAPTRTICRVFEKLDDELYKALQFTVDVYGAEYQEILANSSKFLVLLKRVVKFFEDTKQPQCLGVVALRLMEQLYYKPDMLNEAVYKAIVAGGAIPDEEKSDWEWPSNSQEFMASLCRYVYATGQTRLQRRALLCKAYHLALHNEFQAARDLLHLGNMSFETLTVQDADVHTQILYNRVLAQMGLSAFRLGRIVDAHNSLGDVCMHNKARELLAQGISFGGKNMERTAEQERAERLRQLPYHMHINLEVLESAHHICAMLLEVPNLAMQSIDPNNKRIISRVLRRALDSYDKMLFIGPPENAKEAVVCAAKALQKGDWTSACGALEELKIWDHIDTCNPLNGKNVKEMIKEKIKTEALRTYLFSYASIYDAFHLEQLADMFDLPGKMVHSLVSKMMIKEEITAFWDESSKFVLMQHVEPTPLQRLALTLADRGAQAVANNESLVDQKTGGYGFKDQRPTQQGRWDQDGGKGNRRYGKGGGMDDLKGRKGKGKGKSGMAMSGPPKNRGWENARAGALRGSAQRGWGTAIRN
jgi:translation initiation factor 3 subunit C